MLPIKDVSAPPTTNLTQGYRALAASGRMKDSIEEIETGLAELLSLQNAALSRVERLMAQPGTRAAPADDAQQTRSTESFKRDMTGCQSCAGKHKSSPS